MSEGAEAAAGEATNGRSQFTASLLLAIGCWVAAAALQAALYLRPAPYGGPFLLEWMRYFPFALYYELLGIWLVALPFLLLWIRLYRRPLRAPAWRFRPRVLGPHVRFNRTPVFGATEHGGALSRW